MNYRLVVVLCLLPLGALAQGGCDKELKEIDRRIATGNYPDYNVQLAKTMRDSMAQMCGMFDEQTLAQMMDGFEDVLPVKTEEEKLAEREAKGRAAEASRAVRKQAEAERERSRPSSGLENVTRSGRSVASDFIDRNEDMLQFWTWDWDVYKSKARVIYMTQPSRVQYGRPDWTRNVYVVESAPDGQSTQYLITRKQAHERWTVALRRGHDEIILQRLAGQEGSPTTLERWSVSQQKQLSSVTTPIPTFTHSDKVFWPQFMTPTTDGNVFFQSAYEPQRGQSTAAWYEASPDGSIVGYGTLPLDGGGFTNLGAIWTQEGGAALPFIPKVTLFPEVRILTIAGDASSVSQTAVVKGDIASHDIPPRTLPTMRSVGNGFIVLTKVVADRSLPVPQHGHWLVWVSGDRVEREVYLNPLAEDLNINIKMFDVADNGEIVLYGDSKEHKGTDYVVLLDAQGSPKATAAARQPKNGKIEAIVADDSGVWLFGHGYPTDEFSRFRFWSERIQFIQ
jgi:hypothetical protein